MLFEEEPMVAGGAGFACEHPATRAARRPSRLEANIIFFIHKV